MSTITAKKRYHPTDTVTRYYYFEDIDGNAFDPDTAVGVVYDTDWTEMDEVTLVNIETGKFRFDYNVPSDGVEGTWHILVTATKNAFSNTELFAFQVNKVNPTS